MGLNRLRPAAAAAALACATVLAAPAGAEVVQKSDAGFVLRHAAEVGKDPAEVWPVLLEPARWWSKAHTWSGDFANLTLEPRAGGCFCETLPATEVLGEPGSVEHLRVVHVQPGKVLRMTGGLGPLQSEAAPGTLTITLKEVPGGTRILWEYVGSGFFRQQPEDIQGGFDKVLGEQLSGLAKLLGPLAKKSGSLPPGR